MGGSRAATALVGLVASLLVSAAAWYYYETFLLFLFVPFVPFIFRRRSGSESTPESARECPVCGFQTADRSFEYCPRDGTRLV